MDTDDPVDRIVDLDGELAGQMVAQREIVAGDVVGAGFVILEAAAAPHACSQQQ